MLRRGIRKLSSFLCYRTVRRFWSLRLPAPPASGKSPPVHIELFTAQTPPPMEDLIVVKGKQLDWPKRLMSGDLCFLAYVGGEPVSYLWTCMGQWRVKDEDPPRRLPESAAFLYDAITRSEWRRRGIYAALLQRAAQDLAALGIQELLMLVDDRNTAAQRSPRALGFHPSSSVIQISRILKLVTFRRGCLHSSSGRPVEPLVSNEVS
jgi:GNAT superfamily N-acetyltransferase